MFRLIFLTFFGKQRYDEHHVHVHESPWSMLSPLVVLAILSIFGGWLGDRFSPRVVLSAAFFCVAALGYLCFHGSGSIVPRNDVNANPQDISDFVHGNQKNNEIQFKSDYLLARARAWWMASAAPPTS